MQQDAAQCQYQGVPQMTSKRSHKRSGHALSTTKVLGGCLAILGVVILGVGVYVFTRPASTAGSAGYIEAAQDANTDTETDPAPVKTAVPPLEGQTPKPETERLTKAITRMFSLPSLDTGSWTTLKQSLKDDNIEVSSAFDALYPPISTSSRGGWSVPVIVVDSVEIKPDCTSAVAHIRRAWTAVVYKEDFTGDYRKSCIDQLKNDDSKKEDIVITITKSANDVQYKYKLDWRNAHA